MKSTNILPLLALLLAISCTRNKPVIIRVDMSREHDAGRFQPEKGDRLGIAGNFNDWNVRSDDYDLQDPEGDWIYTIPIQKLTANASEGTQPDTLEFKFVIHAAGGRYIPNNGWETLPNRRFTIADLGTNSPEFIYNRPWQRWPERQVTFTVDMKNQEVLGFFDPKKGDQVVVSGSFSDWSETGIPLIDKNGEGIYQATLPIAANPGQPVSYKFRMISAQKKIMPNHGWETKDNRQIRQLNRDTVLSYAAFNNLRRVARFIIRPDRWIQKGLFKPLKGDILQIRVRLDGQTHLSDPLIKVSSGNWETAMAIPLRSEQTEWQLVRNVHKPLINWRFFSVGLNGAIIRFPESLITVTAKLISDK